MIVPTSRGKFTEQLFNGQVIYCGESNVLSPFSEDAANGVVGYWIPEKRKENSFLGVTAFHVLDFEVELNESDDDVKFLSHKQSCCENVLSEKRYRLERGETTCTYAGGIYDKLLDVGVVRCTNPENSQTVTEISSFQWPRLLFEMVVSEGIQMTDLLSMYVTFHRIDGNISVFHNGTSSTSSERKVGKLYKYLPHRYVDVDERSHSSNERFDSSDHGCDSSGHIGDEIVVEGSMSDGDDLCLKRLQELRSAIDSETSSSSESSDNETDDDPSLEESASSINYLDDEDDQGKPFTDEGDSGCIYFIKIKKDGQIIKAPIAIHRGVCERDPKFYSCASPIEVALRKMQEVHKLDLWFPFHSEPDEASAGQGIESTEEKPIRKGETGAKPAKKSVPDREDVEEKLAPKTISHKESDLQLKKEDDGPKILYPFQEAENLTVGSTVKIEQQNKSVKESCSKQGSMADLKMPEPVEEKKNPDRGSMEKRELENKSVKESGKVDKGGESDSQRNVTSDCEIAEPRQESYNSAEFNKTERETTHVQRGHKIVNCWQNGDVSRDGPSQNYPPAIFEKALN